MGPVLVVSGPSGVGKSTIVSTLQEQDPRVGVSISATTRPRRKNEVDGASYRFLTPDEFERLVADDAFLEHADVHGKRYGTLRADVEEIRRRGQVAVLEIDVQGARAVRDQVPDAHLVFVLPPDPQTLLERLSGRGTEDRSGIELRMANALTELAAVDLFDERLVNDDLDQTVASLRAIIDRLLAA